MSRLLLSVSALALVSLVSSVVLIAVRDGISALPPLTYFARTLPAPGCPLKDPRIAAEPDAEQEKALTPPASETDRPATREELAAARGEQRKCRSAYWLDWWRPRPVGSNARPPDAMEAMR